MDKWTKCGIYNAMKYYPDIKRNEVIIHATTWKNFKNIMLSEMHAQSCPTLCDPMDYSPTPSPYPDSSVHEILQARILEWVAMSFSRESSHPGIKSASFASPGLIGGFFTTSATWEACLVTWKSKSKVAQSCPTLCGHMDCSLLGSSIHGIFQTRVLERVSISFSRGSFQPRDWTQVSRIAGRCITIWATREACS